MGRGWQGSLATAATMQSRFLVLGFYDTAGKLGQPLLLAVSLQQHYIGYILHSDVHHPQQAILLVIAQGMQCVDGSTPFSDSGTLFQCAIDDCLPD